MEFQMVNINITITCVNYKEQIYALLADLDKAIPDPEEQDDANKTSNPKNRSR